MYRDSIAKLYSMKLKLCNNVCISKYVPIFSSPGDMAAKIVTVEPSLWTPWKVDTAPMWTLLIVPSYSTNVNFSWNEDTPIIRTLFLFRRVSTLEGSYCIWYILSHGHIKALLNHTRPSDSQVIAWYEAINSLTAYHPHQPLNYGKI